MPIAKIIENNEVEYQNFSLISFGNIHPKKAIVQVIAIIQQAIPKKKYRFFYNARLHSVPTNLYYSEISHIKSPNLKNDTEHEEILIDLAWNHRYKNPDRPCSTGTGAFEAGRGRKRV